MAADRHKHAAYHNSNSDKLFIGVNIDDLEWPWTPKQGVLVNFFSIFGLARILGANCAEPAGDVPGQPAYDILT